MPDPRDRRSEDSRRGCKCCGRVFAVGHGSRGLTFAELVGVIAIWAITIGGGLALGLLVLGRL